MKTLSFVTIALTAVFAFVLLAGSTSYAQAKKPWDIPVKYKTMKPAVNLKDAGVIATGKELYAKHCKSCHGAKGLGDGPKAATLKTNCGDFSSAAFQAQSDGDIFYQTVIGRDEMPAYGKKVPEVNDQWALVAFMRTLKK